MRKISLLCVLLGLVLVAGSALATTSAPGTGEWTGGFRGGTPAIGVSFSIAKSGSTAQVVGFAATSSVKVPCDRSFLPVSVAGMPSASIRSGKFTAATSVTENVTRVTVTVAGGFTSKHAAAGTVTIALSGICKSTLKWKARFEPPSPPVAGAGYTGATGSEQVGGGSRVSFRVSRSGKTLTSITFEPPIEFTGGCVTPNMIPFVTGRNVAVRGATFIFKVVMGKITHGTGTADTDIITGHFLAGRKAAGTVVSKTDEATLSHCSGSNTWTAHASGH
jgi:hypothetical protein